ncbi:hypothetical protein [Enterovibrio norvegicus]|uniref:hypothetical protein n=1 Tax=Enterovibrio norvegicus TaxID=188144 RepID=UPI0013D77B9D|nr:hypothetical protein [Enterovibrio norvegicus]
MSGTEIIQLSKKRFVSFILDEMVCCFPSLSNETVTITEGVSNEALRHFEGSIQISLGNAIRFDFDRAMVQNLMKYFFSGTYQQQNRDFEAFFLNKKIKQWFSESGLDKDRKLDEKSDFKEIYLNCEDGIIHVSINPDFIETINQKIGFSTSRKLSVKEVSDSMKSMLVTLNIKINNVSSTVGVLGNIEPGMRIKTNQKLENGLMIEHGSTVISKNTFVTIEEGGPLLTLGSVESDYRS